MYKLLITGFDPFGHYQINPSWEVVKALPDKIGTFSLTKLMLPNIYGLETRMLLEKAQEIGPDIILMLGMDSGTTKVHIDTVAINIQDALMEDNMGRRPWNKPIIENGPAAYFATIPAHELVQQLQKEGLHVHLGYSSGGYVCNDVFYSVAHKFNNTKTKFGFIHVPLLPQMIWDEKEALPLEQSLKIVTRIIELLGEMVE